MKDLEGKVAFITGGGSGVALGQAKVFTREGMKVVIADIRRDHLDEAMAYFKERRAQVHAIQTDITDREAFAAAADEAESVFGPVDLLCNTAGVSIFGPIQDATYDDWDRAVISSIPPPCPPSCRYPAPVFTTPPSTRCAA